MTPWVIALAIALILLKAAYGGQNKLNESRSPDGAWAGLGLMTLFSVAALVFVMIAVILANN